MEPRLYALYRLLHRMAQKNGPLASAGLVRNSAKMSINFRNIIFLRRGYKQ